MAIIVKAVCYKSKVLSNNESPLMLRVTKDRKLKYVSLGISLNPVHWDFSKNEPKADCPNREYIEMLIADKIKEYSAKIIELKATHQEFTSTSLVESKCEIYQTQGGGSCLSRVHDFSYKDWTQKLCLVNQTNIQLH